MKRASRLAVLVFCALAFNGCAMLAPDDREFYGRGWLNPKELEDKPYKMPAHPETTGGLGRSANEPLAPSSAPVPVDPILQQ